MKSATLLFALHVAALLFGLGGLLIALPHPELWSGSATAAKVFTFGMSNGGTAHIICGAAAMLVFGIVAIGARKTLIFFVVGTLLPLGAELLGTGTGWPFGGYAYTDGLGAKIAGRVPYSVPLSWFYMGFASYLLATLILGHRAHRRPWLTVLLGAWLLTAWDLVLDPAMASPAMPLHFWTWQEAGPYFGMPVRNLGGWFATGLVFMAVSRLLWREDASTEALPRWFPFSIYVINTIWAMALAVSVGLWPAALLAIAFGVIPACLVWRRGVSGSTPFSRRVSATNSSVSGKVATE